VGESKRESATCSACHVKGGIERKKKREAQLKGSTEGKKSLERKEKGR